MKKHYLTFSLFFIAILSSAQYTWTVKDSFPGTPRRMAAGLSINGLGYIIGGNTVAPSTYVGDVWEYAPSTDSWTQKSNFPYTVATPAYFTINNVGYVVGGSQSTGVYVSTNEQYNPTTDSWTAKASFPENGVTEAFQFVINGLGYVGTGARTGSNTASTMYAYNPETDSWAQMASYPGPQGINMTGFSIDSLGYAGLGQDGAGNFYNQFYKYSSSTNTWTQIASFPGKYRSACTYFVLDGKAYVGGGVSLISGNAYALGDFYEYDPVTNTWSAVPGFPGAPRQYATPLVINDVAYAVGGYDDDNNNAFYNFVNEFGTCGAVTSILPIPGDASNEAGLEIYPNPSTNDVTVKINSIVTSEVKFKIVAVDGKTIKTGFTTQSTFGFSANNFADGVYILSITDSNGTHGAQRFEVMH